MFEKFSNDLRFKNDFSIFFSKRQKTYKLLTKISGQYLRQNIIYDFEIVMILII